MEFKVKIYHFRTQCKKNRTPVCEYYISATDRLTPCVIDASLTRVASVYRSYALTPSPLRHKRYSSPDPHLSPSQPAHPPIFPSPPI